MLTEAAERVALLWDVLLIVVLSTIHIIVTVTNDRSSLKDTDAEKAAELVRGATGGGLTVVGILIPATLLTVTIGTGTRPDVLSPAILVDLFAASVWLLASLVLGVFASYVTGFQGLTTNVLKSNLVPIVLGLQLIFLVAGAVRLVWGLASLADRFA